MSIRILNAQQIIFCVVRVISDVVVCIGYRREPIRVIVSVGGLFTILIGYGRAATSIGKDAKRRMAPRARFELATLRLTAECSTIELPGNRR